MTRKVPCMFGGILTVLMKASVLTSKQCHCVHECCSAGATSKCMFRCQWGTYVCMRQLLPAAWPSLRRQARVMHVVGCSCRCCNSWLKLVDAVLRRDACWTAWRQAGTRREGGGEAGTLEEGAGEAAGNKEGGRRGGGDAREGRRQAGGNEEAGRRGGGDAGGGRRGGEVAGGGRRGGRDAREGRRGGGGRRRRDAGVPRSCEAGSEAGGMRGSNRPRVTGCNHPIQRKGYMSDKHGAAWRQSPR
jgi:hypothetical protein